MPALLNTFLFIEPEQHFLNYGSVVLHQIVEANKQAGQSITELKGSDANPDRIRQELEVLKPVTFVGIGHGNLSIYTVECTAPLLHAENPDELALMKERVVDLVSCLTAQQLGPALINAGAVAYMGYAQEFWFYTADEPGTTRAVQSPFLAAFEFTASLLRGRTTGEARADQLKKYDEEIDYWTTGAGKDNPDAMELSRILEINKSISTFLGEGAVSPSPGARVLSSSFSVPAIILVFGVPLIYALYREIKKA